MTFLLATLFVLMIVAPCVVALRSSRSGNDSEARAEALAEADALAEAQAMAEAQARAYALAEAEALAAAAQALELEAAMSSAAARTRMPAHRPINLQHMADLAQEEALNAHDAVRRAHWAALAADAKAAALHAEAAAQLALEASWRIEMALRAADVDFGVDSLFEDRSSLELPRPRVDHRAA